MEPRKYSAWQAARRCGAMDILPGHRCCFVLAVLWMTAISGGGQAQCLSEETALPKNADAGQIPVQVNGVFPNLTVMAEGVGSDSEAGIGALIPWAQKLWAVGYVAHIRGEGLGLYEISEDMTMRRHPASVTGTFANRMVHWPSGQAFIGPHAIDPNGNVRTIEGLKNFRLTATVSHLTDPKNKVYFLGMEGRFWEVDVRSLEAKLLFNLVKELEIENAKEHFKGAYSADGRVVVANNTYDEKEFLGERQACRSEFHGGRQYRSAEGYAPALQAGHTPQALRRPV